MKDLLIPLVLMLCVFSCESFPKDPHHTLERVKQGKLRVGVCGYWPSTTIQTDSIKKYEMELLEGFAKEIGTDISWETNIENKLIERLEHYKLDMVACRIKASSPWKAHAALTGPYFIDKKEKYVFATPLGENAFILKLEKYLQTKAIKKE